MTMGGETKHDQDGIIGGQGNEMYRFTLITDGLVRYEWAPDSQFEDRPSALAANRDQTRATIPKYQVEETENSLEIDTKRFHLTYDKQPFSPHGFSILVYGHTRSLWRYGERKATLGGTSRTLDGIDGRIDMGNGVCSMDGYATIDDSTTVLFEKDGFVGPRRPGPGRIDGYVFAYGHDYPAAIQALYHISGPTPVLPRWALGNWWSRNYTYTAKSYVELMDQFQTHKIPLSVAVVDMDWHLVDDPRVINAGQTGWTGYTWNKDLFPDPPGFFAELHKRKLKATLNDHPADGVHSYEDLYAEVAKTMGRDPSTKEPIPFNITDHKYAKAYLNVLIRSLEKDGCDFIWIDWQQGQWSRLPGVDPLWVLNYLHFLHNAKFHKDKPLILSRYAGPGSHRYPIGFSGDSIVSWKSLHFQPEFTATASNIGYGWWSHDIGGHMLGVKDDELHTRWVQLGVLSPIMRLHSSKSIWVTKEPWKLSYPYGDIVSFFLRLRHRIIPYLQTMNVRASVHGSPIVQPIYWHHPERDDAYQFRNQYFFGSELLVVPITTPRNASIKLAKVKAWLPPGRYVDLFRGTVYDGDREIWLSRPLEQYPVFLKEGSIIPLDKSIEPENGGGSIIGYEIIVAAGADGIFEILTGENQVVQQRITQITFTESTGTLRIWQTRGLIKGGTSPSAFWSVRFLGIKDNRFIQVKVDGNKRHSEAEISDTGLLVDIGDVLSTSEVLIEIGNNPELSLTDPRSGIKPLLDTAEIEYQLKESVWSIVKDSAAPHTTTIGKLQTVDMSEDLRLAILEFFISDKRISQGK